MADSISTPEAKLPASRLSGLDAFARAGRSTSATPVSLGRAQPRVRGIRRLQADDTRRVRAGQALGDVCAVAKELLENALDAGATRIDVALRGLGGIGGVTVSDNGCGVRESDFDELCLPGATSKQTGSELSTFGFRGAALAAVCATCARVVITTHSRDASGAMRLIYSTRGEVVEKECAARPLGTTVTAERVFDNLPVRKIHAEKHASRELAKVVAMVQAYTLVAFRTRIELRVNGDTKVLFVPLARCMPGTSSAVIGPVAPGEVQMSALRHAVTAVLGRRVLNGLVEFRAQDLHTGAGLLGSAEKIVSAVSVAGLISGAGSSVKGPSRGGPGSHQFIYINRRPVDMARLVRSANEAFRRATGNPGSSPVFVLNLSMPPEHVDVNLAPDKRAVMCEQEVAIVSQIVAKLEAVWAPTQVKEIPTQSIDLKKILRTTVRVRSTAEDHGTPQRLNNDVISDENNIEDALESAISLYSDGTPSPHLPQKRPLPDPHDVQFENESTKVVTPRKRRRPMATFPSSGILEHLRRGSEEMVGPSPVENKCTTNPVDESKPGSLTSSGLVRHPLDHERSPASDSEIRSRLEIGEKLVAKTSLSRDISSFVSKRGENPNGQCATLPRAIERVDLCTEGNPIHGTDQFSNLLPETLESVAVDFSDVHVLDKGRTKKTEKKSSAGDMKVCVDWDKILAEPSKVKEGESLHSSDLADVELNFSSCRVSFEHASVSSANHPRAESTREQEAAVVELTKHFRQEWFSKLRIIGQFNLGFILCSLGHELFIVDQHASDEKRNFEELHRESASTQRLVRPLALNLPAADELLVVERLTDFAAGGYEIEHRADRAPTKRLYLRTQPAMRGRGAFVIDDILEIIASIRHAAIRPGEALRPPRQRALLASRACRKSVMVGDPLDGSRMVSVVSNLANLKHPWTCPHGRPTMRHLCTLRADL